MPFETAFNSVNVPPTAKRYLDAYRVGRFLDSVGLLSKIGGGVLGALVLGLGILATAGIMNAGGTRGTGSELEGAAAFVFFVFLIGSIVVFALLFILGVLISAMGQQLKATLDVAVFSSPFLSKDEKAAAIGIL